MLDGASDRVGLGAILEHLRLVALDERRATLELDDALKRIVIEAKLPEITRMLHEACGAAVRVELRIAERAAPDAPREVDGARVAAAQELPLVREAMDLFDARVVDVEEEEGDPPPL